MLPGGCLRGSTELRGTVPAWGGDPLSPPPTPTWCCGATGGSCGRAPEPPGPMSSTGGMCPSPRWVGAGWGMAVVGGRVVVVEVVVMDE